MLLVFWFPYSLYWCAHKILSFFLLISLEMFRSKNIFFLNIRRTCCIEKERWWNRFHRPLATTIMKLWGRNSMYLISIVIWPPNILFRPRSFMMVVANGLVMEPTLLSNWFQYHSFSIQRNGLQNEQVCHPFNIQNKLRDFGLMKHFLWNW